MYKLLHSGNSSLRRRGQSFIDRRSLKVQILSEILWALLSCVESLETLLKINNEILHRLKSNV